jgi:hypothetical protein
VVKRSTLKVPVEALLPCPVPTATTSPFGWMASALTGKPVMARPPAPKLVSSVPLGR